MDAHVYGYLRSTKCYSGFPEQRAVLLMRPRDRQNDAVVLLLPSALDTARLETRLAGRIGTIEEFQEDDSTVRPRPRPKLVGVRRERDLDCRVR